MQASVFPQSSFHSKVFFCLHGIVSLKTIDFLYCGGIALCRNFGGKFLSCNFSWCQNTSSLPTKLQFPSSRSWLTSFFNGRPSETNFKNFIVFLFHQLQHFKKKRYVSIYFRPSDSHFCITTLTKSCSKVSILNFQFVLEASEKNFGGVPFVEFLRDCKCEEFPLVLTKLFFFKFSLFNNYRFVCLQEGHHRKL